MKNKKRVNSIVMILGLLLIAAALGITGYNIWQQHTAGEASDEVLDDVNEAIDEKWQRTPIGETPAYILNPEMEMPIETIDGVDYVGKIEIPALELELPVINDWSYPHLRIAPCRYSGSAYMNDLVIIAHNYVTHFGRLKNLGPGDQITFTDMDGNEFKYQVIDMEILEPKMVVDMDPSDWDLTLYT